MGKHAELNIEQLIEDLSRNRVGQEEYFALLEEESKRRTTLGLAAAETLLHGVVARNDWVKGIYQRITGITDQPVLQIDALRAIIAPFANLDDGTPLTISFPGGSMGLNELRYRYRNPDLPPREQGLIVRRVWHEGSNAELGSLLQPHERGIDVSLPVYDGDNNRTSLEIATVACNPKGVSRIAVPYVIGHGLMIANRESVSA